MKLSTFFLLNLGFLFCWAAAAPSKPNAGVINVLPRNYSRSEENALEIEITPTNGPLTHGSLGLSLPSGVGFWEYCEPENPGDFLCAHWGDFAKVQMKPGRDPSRCTRIEWTSSFAREIEDCYDLDPRVHWYGGSTTWTYPIENSPRDEWAYLTNGDVHENYWLLSNGAALVIDPDTPLYVSMTSNRPNRFCFIARDNTPYTKRSPLTFNYEWCAGSDIKDAHQRTMALHFDKPSGIPDEEMLVKPFWSTWAEYKEDVNQTSVLDYARRVISEGFGESSHIQIDDDWETCYGDEEWNPVKFPDPKGMVDEIREMNLRTTLWVHPFINYGCPRFDEAFTNGYFVKTARGKPGIVDWWQGGNTGIIDITNPDAEKWWTDRLRKIQQDTGMASFKFDAGEAGNLPSSHVLNGDDKLWPNLYTTRFVEFCSQFGGLVETRVGHRNQKLPVFTRMGDKDSRWGFDNGLKAMIPSLLAFGIMGYPFVLPDMIGGNAYGDGRPSKELYIRWVQVNIFMPSVQFSLVPWNYDDETVQISREVMAQRMKYSEEILTAARQAVEDGSPMNRPLWWVAPNDTVTHTINDAYMLGDNILVAPVVEEGAVSRDIYLPVGTWTSAVDSSVYTGPQWLRDYPAPLNVVPFFVKSG